MPLRIMGDPGADRGHATCRPDDLRNADGPQRGNITGGAEHQDLHGPARRCEDKIGIDREMYLAQQGARKAWRGWVKEARGCGGRS